MHVHDWLHISNDTCLITCLVYCSSWKSCCCCWVSVSITHCPVSFDYRKTFEKIPFASSSCLPVALVLRVVWIPLEMPGLQCIWCNPLSLPSWKMSCSQEEIRFGRRRERNFFERVSLSGKKCQPLPSSFSFSRILCIEPLIPLPHQQLLTPSSLFAGYFIHSSPEVQRVFSSKLRDVSVTPKTRDFSCVRRDSEVSLSFTHDYYVETCNRQTCIQLYYYVCIAILSWLFVVQCKCLDGSFSWE